MHSDNCNGIINNSPVQCLLLSVRVGARVSFSYNLALNKLKTKNQEAKKQPRKFHKCSKSDAAFYSFCLFKPVESSAKGFFLLKNIQYGLVLRSKPL